MYPSSKTRRRRGEEGKRRGPLAIKRERRRRGEEGKRRGYRGDNMLSINQLRVKMLINPNPNVGSNPTRVAMLIIL